MKRKSVIIGATVVALAIIAGSFAHVKSVGKEKVAALRVLSEFKAELDKKDVAAAYARMSNSYRSKWEQSVFRGRSFDYAKKLQFITTKDMVKVSGRHASVFVTADSPDVGFVIQLVNEGGWRIESMDGIWMNE